jgi:chemotaxis protein MotA
MDPGPIIGVVVALVAVLGGNFLEGGHMGSLVGGPAFLIVIGGTIGAVIVQFPLPVCSRAIKSAGDLFKRSTVDEAKLVNEIVEYANRARREGILGLEKLAPNASHPFLAKALMMAIDGADSNTIRDTMEISLAQEAEHGEEGAKVYEAAGGYCPTVGIIGAILGLIHVMSNLSDINKVGTGIAAAFVATIYGVAAANILFLPLAGRIKMRVTHQGKLKEMMLVGVLSIQEGMNPKLVREKLQCFIHEAHGAKAGAAAAPRARPPDGLDLGRSPRASGEERPGAPAPGPPRHKLTRPEGDRSGPRP